MPLFKVSKCQSVINFVWDVMDKLRKNLDESPIVYSISASLLLYRLSLLSGLGSENNHHFRSLNDQKVNSFIINFQSKRQKADSLAKMFCLAYPPSTHSPHFVPMIHDQDMERADRTESFV